MNPRLAEEVTAFRNTFRFTPHNSDVRKVALWIAMALFTFGAVLLMLGRLDLTDPGVASLWTTLVAVMSFLWGDTRRQELHFAQPPEMQ